MSELHPAQNDPSATSWLLAAPFSPGMPSSIHSTDDRSSTSGFPHTPPCHPAESRPSRSQALPSGMSAQPPAPSPLPSSGTAVSAALLGGPGSCGGSNPSGPSSFVSSARPASFPTSFFTLRSGGQKVICYRCVRHDLEKVRRRALAVPSPRLTLPRTRHDQLNDHHATPFICSVLPAADRLTSRRQKVVPFSAVHQCHVTQVRPDPRRTIHRGPGRSSANGSEQGDGSCKLAAYPGCVVDRS